MVEVWPACAPLLGMLEQCGLDWSKARNVVTKDVEICGALEYKSALCLQACIVSLPRVPVSGKAIISTLNLVRHGVADGQLAALPITLNDGT